MYSIIIKKIYKPGLLLLFFLHVAAGYAQLLPGFTPTGKFYEQEITVTDTVKKTVISINAPLALHPNKKTYLVFFALPNGNSIEWTKGKTMQPGNDWHFNIQHIAAQTRYVRQLDSKTNYIVVYLMAAQKSWPAWKRTTPGAIAVIKQITDSITNLFSAYQPHIILNGHSGGGSFIFGLLDSNDAIADNIERIAFLDSDYGYNDTLHRQKLINWLQKSKRHVLTVLAYNDSVVIYNGKPLVSPTGGTWYRSRLMQRNLSTVFNFTTAEDTAFITHKALHGRITFILKQNPQALIYHTEQVERNGFILSLFTYTKFDNRKYFTYFDKRAYNNLISD